MIKKNLKESLFEIKRKIEDDESKFNNSFNKYIYFLSDFEKKENLQKQISRLSLLNSGLSMIEGDECPLCEKEWEGRVLEKQINKKIKELSDVQTTLNGLEEEIDVFKVIWNEIKDSIKIYSTKTEKEPNLNIQILLDITKEIDALLNDKNSSMNKFENLKDYKELCGVKKINKEDFQEHFNNSIKIINDLPEKSDIDESKDFLIKCQEKLENYRKSKRAYSLHERKLEIMSIVIGKYNEVIESYLNNLYNEIESDFSRFYQIVNEDDEMSFTGDLIAKKGALDF